MRLSKLITMLSTKYITIHKRNFSKKHTPTFFGKIMLEILSDTFNKGKLRVFNHALYQIQILQFLILVISPFNDPFSFWGWIFFAVLLIYSILILSGGPYFIKIFDEKLINSSIEPILRKIVVLITVFIMQYMWFTHVTSLEWLKIFVNVAIFAIPLNIIIVKFIEWILGPMIVKMVKVVEDLIYTEIDDNGDDKTSIK